MIKLNPELYNANEFQENDFESGLKGTNTKGVYSTMQFVLRLRDDIHKILDDKNTTNSSEKVEAFSTYLPETIHWWQHVGSNIGFIFSMRYPSVAHIAHRDLKILVSRNEKFKPITKYDQSLPNPHNNDEVNKILNYWHDLRYAYLFILNNRNIETISKDRQFFLSIGHCFHMLWSSSIQLVSTIVDPQYSFLPNINEWTKNFQRLESKKEPGFFPDSQTIISRIGIHAIFEGQARFNQLQYLAIAAGNKYTYDDFYDMRMLEVIYFEAFELFLKSTKIDKPKTLNNSVVALFLLVCDIAINPVDGFPIDIYYYETFIFSNDPGIRFELMCSFIGENKEEWTNAIKDYSAQEYIELSDKLTASMSCFSPYVGAQQVNTWIEKSEAVKKLLEEESKWKFSKENLPIRLFFAKYLRIQEDKVKHPNVFCWIGKCMTAEYNYGKDMALVEKLFHKHKALFIDDVNGEIKPVLFEGYPEENIQETFNDFYTFNTMYDMIVKWIQEDGEFTYNYKWLSPNEEEATVKEWIRSNFYDQFKIYPEDLIILK